MLSAHTWLGFAIALGIMACGDKEDLAQPGGGAAARSGTGAGSGGRGGSGAHGSSAGDASIGGDAGNGGEVDGGSAQERAAAKSNLAFLTVVNGLAGNCDPDTSAVSTLALQLQIDSVQVNANGSAGISSSVITSADPGVHSLSLTYAAHACGSGAITTESVMLEGGHDYLWLISGEHGAELFSFNDITDVYDGELDEVLVVNLIDSPAEILIAPLGEEDLPRTLNLKPRGLQIAHIARGPMYSATVTVSGMTPPPTTFGFKALSYDGFWYESMTLAVTEDDDLTGFAIESGYSGVSF